MFNFFQTIFHKTISVLATAIIAVGLVSVPAQPAKVVKQENTETQTQEVKNQENKENEIEVLKKEIEELKQQTSINKEVPIAQSPIMPTQNTQTTKTNNIVTLPNGAIIETDANGNVNRIIKDIEPVPAEILQILSVSIKPEQTSAKIEWQTNKPSTSKVFISSENFPLKVYNSVSGLSSRHIVSIAGLSGGTNYSYEIEAISNNEIAKRKGYFETLLPTSPIPTKIIVSPDNVHKQLEYLGLYCANPLEINVEILDQSNREMVGQAIEVLNTYTEETKIGTSPLTVNFGLIGMKEGTFLLKIKSGMLETEREIYVREPNFRLITTDGRSVNPNYDAGPFEPDQDNGTYIDQSGGLSLIKTTNGFICDH